MKPDRRRVDRDFVSMWNRQLSVSVPVLRTRLRSRSFQLIWFPGDNVAIYLGVGNVGKVAAVTVGLSSAVKTATGAEMDVRLLPLKRPNRSSRNQWIYHNKQQTRESGPESEVFGFHFLPDKKRFDGNSDILALSLWCLWLKAFRQIMDLLFPLFGHK